MTLTPQLTTILLEMVDAVRSLLASIEQSGGEGDDDYSELVDRLNAVFHGAGAEAALPSMPPMDIVFLRNVLIYFDIETKRQILAPSAGSCAPTGT